MNNKIYIVEVRDSIGNPHVIEAFSSEAKALEYHKEMLYLYDEDLKTGWSIGYSIRTLDREHLDLATLPAHVDKINDLDWCKRFNTWKSDNIALQQQFAPR